MARITIVDPPSGWRYGFPQPLKGNYRQQLIDAGYPLDQIPTAIKYSRFWEVIKKEALEKDE